MSKSRGRALVSVLCIVFGSALFSPTVHAQLISPGKLSSSHASLKGVSNCLKCHARGMKFDNARCLSCHKEIKSRVEKKEGFHASISKSKGCQSCHAEHKGVANKLVQWIGGETHFNHGRTGWDLKGKHRKVKCLGCHRSELVVQKDAIALRQKPDKTVHFLGLPTKCQTCHFDEHRGQLSVKCDRCHTANSFKKTPKFKHDDTDYPLKGAHKKVDCEKCHRIQNDDETAANAFPKPKSMKYATYKDLPHNRCVVCHKDEHRPSRGRRCESCHVVDDWKQLALKKMDRAFHQKTKFPLRGAHRAVDCAQCHGAKRTAARKFSPVAHGRCDTCHIDAHFGQLLHPPKAAPADCSTCHTQVAFRPSTYTEVEHAGAQFVLKDAHVAVACQLCHIADPALRAKGAIAQDHRLSAAKLAFAGDGARCQECHADPHGDQFGAGPSDQQPAAQDEQAKACETCHVSTSFQKLDFDHDKDTQFPLAGGHRDVACTSCHLVDSTLVNQDGKTGKVVRYRGTSPACASCHDDVHFGQMATAAQNTSGNVVATTDCARCHTDVSFEKTLFDHQDPSFAQFSLEGVHRTLDCKQCHTKSQVQAEGKSDVEVIWYRGLPTDCAGCHTDPHQDRFTAFTDVADPNAGAACGRCHTDPDHWKPARFEHDRTGYMLKGAHLEADCQSCHAQPEVTPPPVDCAGCHDDAHNQEFGLQCAGCHEQTSWRPLFSVDAHRSTLFPLTGRHAFIPCRECHTNQRDQNFRTSAIGCAACHEADYQAAQAAVVDHPGSRLARDCQRCHATTHFSPAELPGHTDCFNDPSYGGHALISCQRCHTPARSIIWTGNCSTTPKTANCRQCHG